MAGEAAVHPVGRQRRGVDVDLQAVAGLTKGTTRGQRVRSACQLHIGARNARPVDDEIAAPGQRLAGKPAVTQGKPRLDDGMGPQAAGSRKGAIDRRCRYPREATGIEARQFASGRKRHVLRGIQSVSYTHLDRLKHRKSNKRILETQKQSLIEAQRRAGEALRLAEDQLARAKGEQDIEKGRGNRELAALRLQLAEAELINIGIGCLLYTSRYSELVLQHVDGEQPIEQPGPIFPLHGERLLRIVDAGHHVACHGLK